MVKAARVSQQKGSWSPQAALLPSLACSVAEIGVIPAMEIHAVQAGHSSGLYQGSAWLQLKRFLQFG